MTQIQTMTNQELNRALALILGHTEISEYEDLMRMQRKDYIGSGVFVLYGNQYVLRVDGESRVWDPCNDPVTSLEVQAAARKIDPERYALNLSNRIQPRLTRKVTDAYYGTTVAAMCDATNRERAEAAYQTLQEVRE